MNLASEAADSPQQSIAHYIDGKLADGGSRYADVTNPATGEVSGRLSLADAVTVREAVGSAERAFTTWKNVTPAKRARIMFAYKRLLEENADEIVSLITQEHGKTLADARGELTRGIEVVDYACASPEILKGEHSRNVGPSIDTWSELHPLGVVAGITPFNFPAMVPMWMFPMAIACGNTFVLKPSEKDPSTALLLAKLATEAGLPDGVLNVVNGDADAVNAILDDSRVKAVSFVGSTPVAEYIYSRGTANGKRVQALGGAKNCAIVMPDADLENSANAIMGAAYGSCGERCMAISVAICVGDDTADKLVGLIKDRIGSLKVGDGRNPDAEMGPLITEEHRDRVASYLDIGQSEGAKIEVDGRVSASSSSQGFFLGASVLDNVSPEMQVFKDEIFGPVLCIVRAESQGAAMQMINEHEYGNGTCIFTRDGEAARFFVDGIEVGMVGVNVPLPVPVAFHSFGGWKRSLFGDLHAYGPDSVKFYTRQKMVTQRWPAGGVREAQNFAFPSN